MPPARGSKSLGSKQARPGRGAGVENVQADKEEISQAKRSPSSPQGAPRKRSAFGDITNAHEAQGLAGRKEPVKMIPKKASKGSAPLNVAKNNEINLKKSLDKAPSEEGPAELGDAVNRGLREEQVDPLVVVAAPAGLVTPAEDIDKGQLDDPYANAEYAKDIFIYMREREKSFLLPDYMRNQPDITMEMRAILVDWVVEVQENFELTHETLYLAVKLMDHYLVRVGAMRDKLQLIGSTAILIACKFEERCPPCVDDFLYICDDAYKREELLAMEMSILQTLHFDINIPIAYRFLRRFAKCARATMETLTLARFICELTLQDYAFVQESASRLAAGCLLLALKMKNLGGWASRHRRKDLCGKEETCRARTTGRILGFAGTEGKRAGSLCCSLSSPDGCKGGQGPTLEYYSGYRAQDLLPLVKQLNFLLTHGRDDRLRAVRNKYSHRVFFEVAKIEPVDTQELEKALQS
ncbi:G2/mitotic-specific cyclin-B3 isoform X1 [Python bivittatus]|uniref:G2/mitotic-specific cyclin-B3 isoform X1 n=1 Tax=Python bivittatus TaxID=176946 RepID=A0A9F5ITS1_PYTBI|nr:G2/mitotic-specific cyclin-B3 isoform X1 [Python bivittatus]